MVPVIGNTPPPRRRERARTRRPNRVTVTLTDGELTEYKAAAKREEMAVGAFLARAGLDAARGRDIPASAALRDALTETRKAAALTRQIGVLLNQAVAALHAIGKPVDSLEPIARVAERRLERLDEAVLALLDSA